MAVASTKAFIAQITACYLLGLYLAELRGNKYEDEVATYLDELGKMPQRIEEVLECEDDIREFARSLADATSRPVPRAPRGLSRGDGGARSSSRSWPTSTRKALPRANSSTGRSR